ncbi:MAG: hypothetical protein AVDCRST_MAG18-4267, partial [uncultured Thermomicrobiales bacterium]
DAGDGWGVRYPARSGREFPEVGGNLCGGVGAGAGM